MEFLFFWGELLLVLEVIEIPKRLQTLQYIQLTKKIK